MNTPQVHHTANLFIRSDLRRLGLLVLGIAILFGIVAYFDKTSDIVNRIAHQIYLATLNKG